MGRHTRQAERNCATTSAVSGLAAADQLRRDGINANALSHERSCQTRSADALE